ncbi:UPF0058 family protein [Halobacterium salinarum]|uniref:Metal-binding protein n=1 Tax=Natrinema pellirubrum (strain DSM 15624 / CIP 106293 / JCM 10476 / NCIMB 786 / 157) TaxID=797303 RepID=L0JRH0_NATP1|nr:MULTISPECIES: UPF0058 family protein [Halobacteria]AGB34120.1 putative metal-binding protein [Natrinema pellirubrum DSM 15624]ELY72197.1 hypothetical protein C488_15547 [Natrinema pellirubrum DSM 15624]MDL0139047.1 UPF0058 family protein [Halobacterium salinarum]
MNKQAFLHLHGLLAEVSEQYESRISGDLELDEYETLDTRPTSIHKSKDDHKAAMFALARDITSDMEIDSETEPVAPTAD